jgi:hypothetical protein
MPAKKPNNQEVFEDGQIIDHYVCDMNSEGDCEANGSIENVVIFRGNKYYVYTDWDGNVINPTQKAVVSSDYLV